MIQLVHLVVWLAAGAAAQVGGPATVAEAGAGTAVTPSEAVGVPAGDSAEDAPELASPVPPAGSQDLAWKRSEEAGAVVAERAEAIVAELASLSDHEWAGSYAEGDGLGVNCSLTLAPAGGFTFTWRGCLGLYDRNHGTVRQEGDRLLLDCAWSNPQDGFRGVPTELHIVSWGERRYLIPADRLVTFTTWVHLGYEPRSGGRGLFLMRRGDEQLPAPGRPELPAAWQGYLLDGPIEAVIIAEGLPTERPSRNDEFVSVTMPVTVHTRSEGLLLPGMELRPVAGPNRWHSFTVEVTEVRGPVALGVVRESRRVAEPLRSERQPYLGCRLSTHSR